MTTSTGLWQDDAAPPGPPAAGAAERILVASAMARPDLVDELAADGFDPADIQDDRYRWIWYAVEELRTSIKQGAIAWQAVEQQLLTWHAEGRTPAVPYTGSDLARIYGEAQPGSAAWYADKVATAAIRARIVNFGNTARLKGTSPAFDRDADIAELQQTLDDIVRPEQSAKATAIGDLIGSSLERAVTPPTRDDRIPTGFIDLDACLSGGWAPGQLVVIGARPAMGKTTAAVGHARAAAITNNIPTLFNSLEMSEEELADGILCAEARIPQHHLKQGIVDPAGVARGVAAMERIKAAPLHINDTSSLTLPSLRAQVRQMARTHSVRLVIVDYLQLMQAPRAENRQGEVAKLSRGLKLLAREFGVTVIILAQLNRGPEQRQDKRPVKADLRESGAIEQDADIVILLHREDAYDRDSPRAGEADLIVDKHRGGPVCDVTVAFQGHYARFVDMAVA